VDVASRDLRPWPDREEIPHMQDRICSRMMIEVAQIKFISNGGSRHEIGRCGFEVAGNVRQRSDLAYVID
jgi:hypothetical protein